MSNSHGRHSKDNLALLWTSPGPCRWTRLASCRVGVIMPNKQVGDLLAAYRPALDQAQGGNLAPERLSTAEKLDLVLFISLARSSRRSMTVAPVVTAPALSSWWLPGSTIRPQPKTGSSAV